ncbi:MAG: ArsR/SmtB family transcription factor [Planktomarina sp.]
MDSVFKALNDPARRALLDALRAKDGQSLNDLEQVLNMTRFGVMKHLKVLETANLIIPRKVGRFKYHYLNVLPLQDLMDRWIEPMLAQPAARSINDLKTRLEITMTNKPAFMMQTFISCTQDALWDALTDADAHKNFVFVSDDTSRDGNQVVYKGADGTTMLVCTETELTPKTRIDSTFEPRWAGPDVPLEKSTFAYIITPQPDACMLTLEHYNIPAGQEGIADGWSRTISSLKSWLETGTVTKFPFPQA